MRACVAVAIFLAVVAPLPAQHVAPPAGWTYGVGGILLLWPDEDFNSGGPAVQLSHVGPRRIGFDFRAAYLLRSGPHDRQGVAGMMGLSFGVPLATHLIQLKAGLAGFGLTPGTSENGDSGAGLYVGGGILFRLSPEIGLNLDALLRFYRTSGVSRTTPSLGFTFAALP
jgi:hypothetical protein